MKMVGCVENIHQFMDMEGIHMENSNMILITPKVKNRYKDTNMGCWRNCGSRNADHSHVFCKFPKIVFFPKILEKCVLN